MGNRQSAPPEKRNPVGPYGEEIGNLFEELCKIGVLSQENFEKAFEGPSKIVTRNLFQRFFIDLLNSNVTTKRLFIERVQYILEIAFKSQTEQFCFYMDILCQTNTDLDKKELERIVNECESFGLLLEHDEEEEVTSNNDGDVANHGISTDDDKEVTSKSNDDGDGANHAISTDGEKEVTSNNDDDVENHAISTDGDKEEISNNGEVSNGQTTASDICKNIFNTCSCMKGEKLREKFISWCMENCPKMFHGLQSWLLYKFTKVKTKGGMEMIPLPLECETSKLQLNGSLLWFLCCLLPTCFTRMENKFKVIEDSEHEVDEETKYTWNLLYDSNQHGLSLNRFKHKVMSYKSPTVSIIEFARGLKVILALDEPWVDSPEKFGGPYCMLIEISPEVKIIEANSKMVYLKELGRSIPTGLLIGSETRSKISINKDLSTAQVNYKHFIDENIERIEVWGCGGVEAIKSQADMKKWERKEIEKRKKVKLPGQWDQDKTILEMGGVTVNHSQRGDI